MDFLCLKKQNYYMYFLRRKKLYLILMIRSSRHLKTDLDKEKVANGEN